MTARGIRGFRALSIYDASMAEIIDVRIEHPGERGPAVVVVMSNGVVLRDRLPTLEEARRKVLAVQAKAWSAVRA